MSTEKLSTSLPAIVGSLLTRIRKERGFSQQVLAAKVGVSQPYWSKVEAGTAVLSLTQVWRAADALRVSPGDLVAQVDNAKTQLESQGIQVDMNSGDADNSTARLVGAAVLGALLATMVLRGK